MAQLTLQSPWGSFLDPLLLLIYINDLPQSLLESDCLYADGTFIFYQDKDDQKNEDVLSKEF